MRKAFVITFAALIIIVLGAVVFWNFVPTIVSSQLTERAKVDVSIQSIGMTPSSVWVKKLQVENPPKNLVPYALTTKKIDVDVPLIHFFHKNIAIDEINMNNVYLSLIFESMENKNGNWSTIMSNIQSSASSDQEKAKASGKSKTVLIKRLMITDLEVDLGYLSHGKVNRIAKIPRLEFTNVSSEGGIPTAQIMNLIVTHVLKEVLLKEGLKGAIDSILPGAGSAGSGFEGTIKGLF